MLRGYSGYNTRWARKVAERAFEGLPGQRFNISTDAAASCSADEAPLAVTLFFGANDACLPDRSSAFQHVPLPEYQLNLRAIFSFLKVVTCPVPCSRIVAHQPARRNASDLAILSWSVSRC